jgi:hypothetical protein
VALIYQAQLTPSKLELLQDWVPNQPWLDGIEAGTLKVLGAYRFDDPAGEVGIETHLLATADHAVLQVPLTYRNAPLPGVESIATLQHSVLGRRWVYDGCADPVYVAALATAILAGGSQASLEYVTATGRERRESTTAVSGSGTADTVIAPGEISCITCGAMSVIRVGELELVVFHVLNDDAPAAGAQTLRGSWPGHQGPALLATAR